MNMSCLMMNYCAFILFTLASSGMKYKFYFLFFTIFSTFDFSVNRHAFSFLSQLKAALLSFRSGSDTDILANAVFCDH